MERGGRRRRLGLRRDGLPAVGAGGARRRLPRASARLAGAGLDTAFVDPAEIAEIEPLLALDGIAGAAYEPDGGFADAHKMILGWFAAGVAHGLVPRLGYAATA